MLAEILKEVEKIWSGNDKIIVGYLLWVSLQNLDSVLQSIENLGQALSALSNIWRLAEELGHLRVALSGVVEIELQ